MGKFAIGYSAKVTLELLAQDLAMGFAYQLEGQSSILGLLGDPLPFFPPLPLLLGFLAGVEGVVLVLESSQEAGRGVRGLSLSLLGLDGVLFLGLGCKRLERSLRMDVTSYRASSRLQPEDRNAVGNLNLK